MKKMLCFFLAGGLFLAGCTESGSGEVPTPGPQDPDLPEISSDSVYVKLCVGGELKITTEPLGRATSDRDLFALNVFSEQEKYEGTTENISGDFTPYAYGYFDDLNLIVLKLAKNRYYHFALAYIPNGKDVLYRYPNGNYGNPCHCTFSRNGDLNEMVYAGADGLGYLNTRTGSSQGKDVSSDLLMHSDFNAIERYQGCLYNFSPQESSSVTINLYRMMVGFKIIADDFTEGKITLFGNSSEGCKYVMTPKEGSSTNILDVTVESPFMPHPTIGVRPEILAQTEKQFSDTCQEYVTIVYTTPDGKEILLYKRYITYKRLTKYVMQFSLSDAIVNGGIDANIMDTPGGELAEEPWEM